MSWFVDFWLVIMLIATVVFTFFAVKHIWLDNEDTKIEGKIPIKVLIVDDQKELLDHLGEHLQENNFRVHLANTVEEAERLITQEKFHYAILDLQIKAQHNEWGGVEIFKFLRKNNINTQPIVLSAHSLNDIRDAGYPNEALEMQNIFVSKGDPKRNYMLAVLEKISGFHQALS